MQYKIKRLEELESMMEKEYSVLQKEKESVLEEWLMVLEHSFKAGIPRWRDITLPKPFSNTTTFQNQLTLNILFVSSVPNRGSSCNLNTISLCKILAQSISTYIPLHQMYVILPFQSNPIKETNMLLQLFYKHC